MNIEVIGSLDGLEKLKPEWWNLYRNCPRATPFQSPQWLVPWTRRLFRGGEILALAMRERGELTGFAPLFCWGTGERTISFLGAGISDYGDILFAPETESECCAAVWNFLASRRGLGDALDLREVRAGAGLAEGRRAEECSVCPVLDLATYPDTMDHKHRTDVRRARNKLSKHSGLRFAIADQGSFARDLEEFFGLHQARWGAMEDSILGFHREAAAGFLDAGLLRLCLLRIDNVPAAAIYAFATGHTLYCYLSGFDPALARLSPGAVLLGWLIETAMAAGIREVDFLREPEAYKYLWGARDRVSYRLSAGSS